MTQTLISVNIHKLNGGYILIIDKVSERAKNRVIEILSTGVDTHTVRVCSTGLAGDYVTNGRGLQSVIDGGPDGAGAMEIAGKVATELMGNERNYAELALRIYSAHITEQVINKTLDTIFGKVRSRLAGEL